MRCRRRRRFSHARRTALAARRHIAKPSRAVLRLLSFFSHNPTFSPLFLLGVIPDDEQGPVVVLRAYPFVLLLTFLGHIPCVEGASLHHHGTQSQFESFGEHPV